jgi:hypothetical protein
MGSRYGLCRRLGGGIMEFVFKYLADSDVVDMSASSDTSKTFEYTVPAGKNFYLQRVNFVIVDGSITPAKFGGLSALTNGLKIQVLSSAGAEVIDFTDGQNIKTNSDFALLAGVDSIIRPAAGDDMFPVRWTIDKAGDLKAEKGNFIMGPLSVFRITVQDDLSGITLFKAMIQGVTEDVGKAF